MSSELLFVQRIMHCIMSAGLLGGFAVNCAEINWDPVFKFSAVLSADWVST